MSSTSPRVVVVIIDGLPIPLLETMHPELTFLRERTPHVTSAVSCFPSTTGPAYFPFLAGASPGRANVTGIRWFDRGHPTRTRFPHRGLRSYVGPDAGKMSTDTVLRTLFAEHAWPVSSPVAKDLPKRREKSRDLVWATAHFTERWDWADRRTNWKLGRSMAKGRPVVFAVFPSVDEFGHTLGFDGGRPAEALVEIDRMLTETLGEFEGEVLVSADHGLTATENHIDLRGEVERLTGPTVAYPLVAKPNPVSVVCESGNAMAHVYLRGDDGWRALPPPERCRELATRLLEIEGIDSVAIRGDEPHSAELHTRAGVGRVSWDAGSGFAQEGSAFATSFTGADPAEALAATAGEEHPDAPFALLALFASRRTGDLLVSARVGWDLRTDREWPTHHASHGALHRHHTVVPLLSSSPLEARPRRTIDIFSETLRLASIELADYPQSDAALLAAGAWTPGVAEAP